jgi:hypothetical protein
MMRARTYGSSMRSMLGAVRQRARVLHPELLAVGHHHPVLHVGHGGDQVQVELALQPLLDDLHVQQPQEAAAEAEAERGGGLRLVGERRVVQLQLLERVAQLLVLLGVRGVEPGEHHRLDLLVAGQQLRRAVVGVEDGVADLGVRHRLMAAVR